MDRVERRRAPLGLALAVLGVSFSAIFIRLAASPPLVTGAARMLLAGLFTVPLAIPGLRRLPRPSVQERRAFGLAALSLAVHFATWIGSLSLTDVASSVLLVNVHPLAVMGYERLVLRRPVGTRAFLGASVALFGMLFLLGGDLRLGLRPFLGDLLALAGALASAAYVLAGQAVRRRLANLPYTAALYLSAGVLLAAGAALLGESWPGRLLPAYPYFLALAVVPTLLGHSLVNAVLRHLPASTVAVALLGEPVLTAVWAWLLLAQHPTPLEMLGGMITLGGMALALSSRAGLQLPAAPAPDA